MLNYKTYKADKKKADLLISREKRYCKSLKASAKKTKTQNITECMLT